LTVTNPARPTANARLAAHTVFDPEFRELRRLLRGGGRPDAHDFEAAIGLLLHVCGFSVAQYGSSGPFRDGPDLVAVCGARPIVLAVECTLREIDSKSKLLKLYHRWQQLAEAMPTHQVVAAVFTPLPHAEIAAHERERAQQLGIAVASAEIIERLRDLAVDRVADAGGVLEQLRFEAS